MIDITKEACLHRLSYMKYGMVIETEKWHATYIYIWKSLWLVGWCRKDANVKGFFIWALMDNMEMGSGYNVRFGLNYVDYLDNLNRHPKKSAKWLRSFLKEWQSEGLNCDLSDLTFSFLLSLMSLVTLVVIFCMVHCLWCFKNNYWGYVILSFSQQLIFYIWFIF